MPPSTTQEGPDDLLAQARAALGRSQPQLAADLAMQVLRKQPFLPDAHYLAGMAAQARWEELLGARHSYFCGAYWANGFHEDGMVSALRVARAFGEEL